MSSYVVTGVSRGIGYEFIRQYSSDPNNTVVGLVRNKPETDQKIAEDPELSGRQNLHILEADVTDYEALEKAAAETAKITGGGVDYLIGNAALVPQFDGYGPIGSLADRPKEVTGLLRDLFEVNVIGQVHLINLFLPLIYKGEAKKVIMISTGFADPVATNEGGFATGALYGSSKAALNLLVAKYSAQYKHDGILFLALSPGAVDVGHTKNATPEQLQALGAIMASFQKYAPDFKGPMTAEESVKAMTSVFTNASIEKGNGGDFLSHFGNKQWV